MDYGHDTVIDGVRTVWGWIYEIESALFIGAFGLLGGLTFWLVVTRGGRPTKSAAEK